MRVAQLRTTRGVLIKDGADLILGFQAQRVDTSFPGWVPVNPVTGKSPNIWKTASLVLLTLFPVVMLELKFLTPHLHALPPAVGTFIGNGISVALTTWPLIRWRLPHLCDGYSRKSHRVGSTSRFRR